MGGARGRGARPPKDERVAVAEETVQDKLRLIFRFQRVKMSSEVSRLPTRSQSVPPTDRASTYANRYSNTSDSRKPSSLDPQFRRSRTKSPQKSESVQQMPPYPSNYYPYPGTGYANPGNALNHGFPPQNFLLSAFLTGGHFPFDFRGPWMNNHQKHHNWGAWNAGRSYHKSSWGPVF
ncbi:hypothetical protein QR680_004191 [Steinernema hermaphroditum]|uniref:Uncharacterized protein n=1 Tax=Steinernema hermaphroditum TaxID=289476 RepID=A0AA39HMX2_9BILA|nr:hypothetical protein QR680_004191 [Steinernema hermaphroditum]